MSAIDTRHISRDSLFLLAEVRLGRQVSDDRVKVRNLSSGGMMAEGGPRVERGANIAINLRNIGWVEGTVAWVHESRFGIAFAHEIDPAVARASEKRSEYEIPRFVRNATSLATSSEYDVSGLRKV